MHVDMGFVLFFATLTPYSAQKDLQKQEILCDCKIFVLFHVFLCMKEKSGPCPKLCGIILTHENWVVCLRRKFNTANKASYRAVLS